jgi:ABC-type transport system involved in multi-copper enzyme maturation permease subunit
MLPGPVFNFELLITARRGRFYVLRALYAAVLLIILWGIHSAWSSTFETAELPSSMVKWFAVSAFGGITIGQEILVLVLTPALVAGVIADEKKRKTLHYLMASRLTSPEIVIGKLFVRMLYVGVLLGVSVPVLSLLVLLGGIDPWLVALGCGATLSTAWFLATLSIWVSTIARRPREALFIAYGLEGLWLVVPSLLTSLLPTGYRVIDVPVVHVVTWLAASSPVDVFWEVSSMLVVGVARWRGALWGISGTGAGYTEMIYWMMGLQVAAGSVLAALAAVQLRPVFRRQDGAVSQPRGIRAILESRGRRSHRPVRDRPMLWKELQTGGARGFARFVGWLLTLIGGGFLAYYSVWLGLMAFLELWQEGSVMRMDWRVAHARWRFFEFLTVVAYLLYLVGIVTIAGAAAAGITSEHEEDTWVSLTATDLTGREIVFAKILGSLWRPRRLGAVLGLLVLAGVGLGSLHPLSLPALVLALLVYGWFAAALGVWVSIQLRSTWRAQFLTIAGLLLVNVSGQGIINMLSPQGFAPQLWPGFTPYEVSKLIVSPDIPSRLSRTNWPRFWRLWDVDDDLGWVATFSIMSLLIYTSLAAFLTWDALRRFEIVAGRARRSRMVNLDPSMSGDRIESKAEEPAIAGSVA